VKKLFLNFSPQEIVTKESYSAMSSSFKFVCRSHSNTLKSSSFLVGCLMENEIIGEEAVLQCQINLQ